MTKIISTSEKETEYGKLKTIKQNNGVTIKVLTNPTKKYLDKKKVQRAAHKESEEKVKKENMIKDRMRQMAIDSLKKEGKL